MHIFCTECNNYIYDPEWEQSLARSKRAKTEVPEETDTSEDSDDDSTVGNEHKTPQGNTTSNDNSYESSLEAVLAKYERDITICTWKPRVKGFKNLGNTCYMSTILQCMAHNPLIRNWFLSDMHQGCRVHEKHMLTLMSQAQCKPPQKQSGPGCHHHYHHHATNSNDSCDDFDTEDLCVSCEFWDILNTMFSETLCSIVPNKFLYAVWRKAESCASYEQQDAHEFFITLTNLMHTELISTLDGGTAFTAIENGGVSEDNCECIIHKSFCGLLESDVTCLRCKKSSPSSNIFTDISLDIPANQEATTLAACLDLFTTPEVLSKTEQFYCSECKCHCDSTKQLTISRLPNVLCIHFKRFAHNTARHTLSKVDTKIEFPSIFDMSPWTTNGKKDRPAQKSFYELFAVLNHIGRIDSGHYTCYVRSGKQWFFCNDTAISEVELSQVRKSQA